MGFSVALDYLRDNPGYHSVEEIADAIGADITRRSVDGNLRYYLSKKVGTFLDTRLGDVKDNGRPARLYAWRDE